MYLRPLVGEGEAVDDSLNVVKNAVRTVVKAVHEAVDNGLYLIKAIFGCIVCVTSELLTAVFEGVLCAIDEEL